MTERQHADAATRKFASEGHQNPVPRSAVALPMDAGRLRLLGINADAWRHHASSWSVWTRFATLPFLVLAIWSHTWIGVAWACALTLAVIIWLWFNPRLFAAPKNFNTWAARATFGERVWLNRSVTPIPQPLTYMALAFSAITGLGFIFAIWGAIETIPILIFAGIAFTFGGKLAFLELMARIYDLKRHSHPLYTAWTQIPDNDNAPPKKHRKAL